MFVFPNQLDTLVLAGGGVRNCARWRVDRGTGPCVAGHAAHGFRVKHLCKGGLKLITTAGCRHDAGTYVPVTETFTWQDTTPFHIPSPQNDAIGVKAIPSTQDLPRFSINHVLHLHKADLRKEGLLRSHILCSKHLAIQFLLLPSARRAGGLQRLYVCSLQVRVSSLMYLTVWCTDCMLFG